MNLCNRDSDLLKHYKDSFRFTESESNLPNTSYELLFPSFPQDLTLEEDTLDRARQGGAAH